MKMTCNSKSFNTTYKGVIYQNVSFQGAATEAGGPATGNANIIMAESDAKAYEIGHSYTIAIAPAA